MFRRRGDGARSGPDDVPGTRDSAPLAIRSCRDICEWSRTPATRRGEPLFTCRGCGSQWVPSEPWTPADRTGRVPADVRDELRRRDGA